MNRSKNLYLILNFLLLISHNFIGVSVLILLNSSALHANPGDLVNDENSPWHEIEKDVTFWCRNRATGEDEQISSNKFSQSGLVNSSNPFIFFIHGWSADRNTRWITEAIKVFIKHIAGVNVCMIDWARPSNSVYTLDGFKNIYEVGNYVAKVYKTNKLNLNKVYLVGHSVAAHLAGHIGKMLNGRLGKIFGLDPSGPLHCYPVPVDPGHRLDASDAQYVQIINTCKNWYGCGLDSGHAIFDANGGNAPQPGCPVLQSEPENTFGCSHGIVTDYFRMSLNPAKHYKGISYYVLIGAKPKRDRMGYHAAGFSGRFYVSINTSGHLY